MDFIIDVEYNTIDSCFGVLKEDTFFKSDSKQTMEKLHEFFFFTIFPNCFFGIQQFHFAKNQNH